jgi:hypothetical protein
VLQLPHKLCVNDDGVERLGCQRHYSDSTWVAHEAARHGSLQGMSDGRLRDSTWPICKQGR